MDPRLEKDGDAAVIGDGYEGGPGAGTGGGGGRLSTPVPMVPVVSPSALAAVHHQSLAQFCNVALI